MADDNPHVHLYLAEKAKKARKDGEEMTVAILRCACGDFTHAQIPGDWSLEELQGTHTPEPSDAEFLTAMGIAVPKANA